jgi:hypothetical protein
MVAFFAVVGLAERVVGTPSLELSGAGLATAGATLELSTGTPVVLVAPSDVTGAGAGAGEAPALEYLVQGARGWSQATPLASQPGKATFTLPVGNVSVCVRARAGAKTSAEGGPYHFVVRGESRQKGIPVVRNNPHSVTSMFALWSMKCLRSYGACRVLCCRVHGGTWESPCPGLVPVPVLVEALALKLAPLRFGVDAPTAAACSA